MAKQKIQVIGPLVQRTDQAITLSKNSEFTQASTDGRSLTAYLYDEDSFGTMTGGVDVTVGSPVGAAQDTDVVLEIDTLTGVTLSNRTERWALYIVDDSGEQLIPNKATGDVVFLLLQKVPS
jgi:hypothetical protein